MSEVDNRCEHQKHDWKHGMKQMCLECYDEEHAELQLFREQKADRQGTPMILTAGGMNEEV